MDLSACNSAEQESSAESSMSLSPSVRSSTSSRCIFGFIQNVQLATLAVKKRALPTRNISLLSNALIHKQSSPNVSFNGLGTRESCDGLQLDGEINEPTLHSPLSPTAPIEIPNTTYFKEQAQIEERQRLQNARIQYRQTVERQLQNLQQQQQLCQT